MFKNVSDAEWGSAKPVAAQPTAAVDAQGQPQTLVKIEGPATGTRMITVAMHALPVINPASPDIPFAGGPFVGVVEWSGGGGGGSIEFDVPTNRSGGSPRTAILAGVGKGSGAMVAVPASVIKAHVRNDCNVLVGPLTAGVPPVGAIPLGTSAVNLAPLIPIVSGVASYEGKVGRLQRTVWAVKQANATQLAAPAVVNINVPPYARSFRLLRMQSVAADVILVTLNGPSNTNAAIETFSIPGTAPCPEIIVGPAVTVRLDFPVANAGTLESLCAVFEIENN